MRAPDFDVITLGRVSVDLYPEQIGLPLAQVRSFAKSLGGSPTNVAVGVARLGHRAAVITKVGDDGFGVYVRRALDEFGVDARWVGTHPVLRTPLVFCEIFPPDRFPLLFYRQPKAPDLEVRADEFDREALGRARLVWTTGSALSEEPSRSATLAALDAARGIRVHDLDYRPSFWQSVEAARTLAREAVRRATVVVGNAEEIEMATGTTDPQAAARDLLARGPELVVVKRADEGASAFTRDRRVDAPGVRIDVLCALGAGDAFGAALCHALLEGWELERTLRFANAAGAIVASRLACADAMPTRDEVERLVAVRA